jgi:hypothetical protein
MERKFYPENFERFLKGHADQFKMTPSKKVWHGIYNDLHPGRRWPSIAMTLVFIFTLVIIGHLNTSNGDKTSLPDLTSLQSTSQIKNPATSTIVKSLNQPDTKVITPENDSDEIHPDDIIEDNAPLLTVIKDPEPQIKTETVSESKPNNIILENKTEELPSDKIKNDIAKVINDSKEESKILLQEPAEIKTEEEFLNTPVSNVKENVSPEKENDPEALSKPSTIKISKPKKISNISWSLFLSPSVSYRLISEEKINNSVIHHRRLGYEAGTAMSFNILKKLQFTSGLQLNYSGYNITANNIHPMVATLALNSDTQQGQYDVFSTMSTYGNSTGSEPIRLKNYSLQASIPLGLQYSFAGNDNIKFGAAASFQPSFVVASQAYFLSEDRRNYLKNSYLHRTWNMNTNFTTYVAFSSNSLKWQIGPQVRYQLLSTYTNRYPVKENLINYGIRISISKGSK